MLIVGARQLEPMLDRLSLIPETLGRTAELLADAGYFSQADVEHCRERQVAQLIACRRISITFLNSIILPGLHPSMRRRAG